MHNFASTNVCVQALMYVCNYIDSGRYLGLQRRDPSFNGWLWTMVYQYINTMLFHAGINY